MSHETGRKVLQIEAEAILSLIPRLGQAFDRAVEILESEKAIRLAVLS